METGTQVTIASLVDVCVTKKLQDDFWVIKSTGQLQGSVSKFLYDCDIHSWILQQLVGNGPVSLIACKMKRCLAVQARQVDLDPWNAEQERDKFQLSKMAGRCKKHRSFIKRIAIKNSINVGTLHLDELPEHRHVVLSHGKKRSLVPVPFT